MATRSEQIRSVMGGASTAILLFGIGYLVDCRLSGGAVDHCWLTGGSLAGLGTAGQAGYKAGFWTPNPGIRQQERNRIAKVDTPDP